jgi:serine/threonine protein kinase
MLGRLEHVHIVKSIDHCISPDRATIVMEYRAQGDLRTLIDDAVVNKWVPLLHESRFFSDRSVGDYLGI